MRRVYAVLLIAIMSAASTEDLDEVSKGSRLYLGMIGKKGNADIQQ